MGCKKVQRAKRKKPNPSQGQETVSWERTRADFTISIFPNVQKILVLSARQNLTAYGYGWRLKWRKKLLSNRKMRGDPNHRVCKSNLRRTRRSLSLIPSLLPNASKIIDTTYLKIIYNSQRFSTQIINNSPIFWVLLRYRPVVIQTALLDRW